MKKVISMLLATTMLFSAVGCGGTDKGSNPAPSETAQTSEVTPIGDVTKIALLVSGTLGDKSFHDSSKAGLDAIQEKYGDAVETKVIEMGSDKTKFVPTLEDVSVQGYNIILTGTFHMKEPIEEVAPNYPDVTYVVYDTTVDYEGVQGLENVYSITYKQNEAGFLAGYVAANVTKDTSLENINEEKKIGFLGASDSPIINDFLVGYIEGAQYVDPDTKVDVAYIDSFTDAARGKELALIQYKNNGVDIGFNVAGRAGLGQIDAAAETQMYAIGVDSDQAKAFEDAPEKADRIVTSALKRVDLSLVRAVDLYFEGSLPKGTTEVLGLKEGGVGIVEDGNFVTLVNDEARAGLEEVKEKLIDGSLEVKSTTTMDAEKVKALIESAK